MPNLPYPGAVGVHALLWAGDTTRASIELAVRRSAECGFDLIELSLHDLDRLDVAHARQTIDGAGLKVACSRGLAIDADVSDENTAVVERGAKLLLASMEATAALGGRILTGALYSAFRKFDRPLSSAGGAAQRAPRPAKRPHAMWSYRRRSAIATKPASTRRQMLRLADDIGGARLVIHLRRTT